MAPDSAASVATCAAACAMLSGGLSGACRRCKSVQDGDPDVCAALLPGLLLTPMLSLCLRQCMRGRVSTTQQGAFWCRVTAHLHH